MELLTRRSLLQSTALAACTPSLCRAALEGCCTVPEVPADAIRIEPGILTIDLARTPALARTGSMAKIVDASQKLHLIVARPGKHEFVALDQKCTHGGGALTYVHKHKHLYCTCWGHAKFALDGSVLRWPNKQTPRPLRAYRAERRESLLDIHVEGLA